MLPDITLQAEHGEILSVKLSASGVTRGIVEVTRGSVNLDGSPFAVTEKYTLYADGWVKSYAGGEGGALEPASAPSAHGPLVDPQAQYVDLVGASVMLENRVQALEGKVELLERHAAVMSAHHIAGETMQEYLSQVKDSVAGWDARLEAVRKAIPQTPAIEAQSVE